MANPEHVEVVRQGAAAIAAWRKQNPDTVLNLSGVNSSLFDDDFIGVDLIETDLRGANLSRAHLLEAILSDSDLSDADLSDADLTMAQAERANFSRASLYYASLLDANLTDADLREADLGHSELSSTILRNADLSQADLGYATLLGADLAGANLAGATVIGTTFADVDLSKTRGLDGLIHKGPSTLDHRTLVRSGELPLEFLRGVGLPDEVIDFYRAQYGKPIQYYSAFISYSRNDEEFVDRLYADLQDNGVRCWRDTEDMKIGDRMRPVIDRAIRLHDKVVLVLSKHSIASDWVETEVETAFRTERDEDRIVLFPVRVDDAIEQTDEAWARQLWDTRNIGDFRGWKDHDSYQAAFERVLRDLRPEAE